MSDIPPMYECLVWNHTDAHSTRRCIQWLKTQPRRDTIGYIQIGQQRPHEITHKNRHTWEKILDDCDQELTQFCNICGQEMPPATGASYHKDIEQNEDATKWYDCPHCDAGYPDQKCICKESEE